MGTVSEILFLYSLSYVQQSTQSVLGTNYTRLIWTSKTKLGRFVSDVSKSISDEKTDARRRHDDEAKRHFRRRQSQLLRASSNGRHR